jgi:WD40 repeat protein
MDPDDAAQTQRCEPISSSSNADPFRAELQPPPFIPDHELLRCIGRGSYGVVWLARNMMGAYRAVKVVYRKSFTHQRPFDRELSGIRKFEPISRSREGFIDVLHVGINEEEGYFYYVMEVGDDRTSGQTIDAKNYAAKTLAQEITAAGRLSVQECVQLGLALSQALADLHRHGLVHRDIKPSNIIFVNGVPKLADIGLVAEVEEARSYVGTEGFIPPEGPGTPQADIFSLGKVLYEVSTGKDRQDFPELPTLWDEAADHEWFLELNEVVLRACKSDPARRYQSAGDLHADLVLLTNGKSVKRLRLLERRLATLKRVATVSAAVGLALAVIGYQIFRERRRAEEARQREVGGSVAYGNRAMESGDLTGALPFFAEALRLDQGNKEGEGIHRMRFGSVLAQCPKLIQMLFTGKHVHYGEISPDGKKILIVFLNGPAEIHDLQTGELYSHPFGEEHWLIRANYSPDGRSVVSAGADGMASIWDTTTLQEVGVLPHSNRVYSARFSRDGLRIVTACADGVARVWNAKTRELELSLTTHTDSVRFADFSHDGRLIVTTSSDMTAAIWDAKEGRCLRPGLRHQNWVTYAAFSPNDRLLVTASDDKKTRLWDVETGRRIMPDLKHGDAVWSAEFSPDGRWILTASLEGKVRLWLASTLEPLLTNPVLWHGERVTHASFSPDGSRIVTSCADGTVRVWDLAGNAGEPSPTREAFSQDKSHFLLTTNNGLEVCDTLSRRPVSPRIEIGARIHEAKLSGDGRYVLVTTLSPESATPAVPILEIRESQNGRRIGPPLPVTNRLAQVLLSHDGKRLLAYDGQTAQTWDVMSGVQLAKAMLHEGNIKSAVFSPSGNELATWTENVTRVWDSATGSTRFAPLTNPVPVKHVEFSPDGSRLITCGADPQLTKCSAQIWRTSTGEPVGPPLMHGDGVLWATFSPDGRRVVTTGEDFAAIIWDSATGRQLRTLKHAHQVNTAMFSPDSRWIVTDCADQTARVWNAETGDPLTPLLRHVEWPQNAVFLDGGHTVATFTLQGDTAWLWPLPEDKRSADDLARLARLLTGDSVAASTGPGSSPPTPLASTWKELGDKYPGTFTTSSQEIADWHELQAKESEFAKDWSAVAFHLRCLASQHPQDASLNQRLARAEQRLSNGK